MESRAGEKTVSADVLPTLYRELRRLAQAQMNHERADHTLNATALVHEAWLRLGTQNGITDRAQFIRAAAEAMRRILVDHARARQAAKRGGDWREVPLPDVPAAKDNRLEAVNEALDQLQVHDPIAAELVKLRYFCNYSHTEAAEILGLSRRQADGLWTLAKAWLFQVLQHEPSD